MYTYINYSLNNYTNYIYYILPVWQKGLIMNVEKEERNNLNITQTFINTIFRFKLFCGGFKEDTIVCCDTNAHDHVRGSADISDSGEIFIEFILSSELEICKICNELKLLLIDMGDADTSIRRQISHFISFRKNGQKTKSRKLGHV